VIGKAGSVIIRKILMVAVVVAAAVMVTVKVVEAAKVATGTVEQQCPTGVRDRWVLWGAARAVLVVLRVKVP
tara:strand:+ start:49 stop:264 length:216 start_codon:yes stop_codon:yes gene_type:complete